ATLPLARPLLATGLVLVFLLALAEFGVPALMQVEVYPVAIYAAFSASYDFAQAAALCLPLVGVAAVVAFILHHLAHGVDFASLAAQHWAPRRVGLGSGRLAATLAAFTLFALVLGLPLGTLALKAGEPRAWSGALVPLLWSLGLSALSASLLVLLETISKRGLRGIPHAGLHGQHARIPPAERVSPFVVQHLHPHLKQEVGTPWCPAHLLFFHHPLADHLIDR
ncbi:MAG: hypothetical protein HYW07_00910, partial [Candidatus Latescibacteria bacterium]|nr:hypothetical protein [Candidatus Latescibacterota bacterium]